jgi:hypothetical protein
MIERRESNGEMIKRRKIRRKMVRRKRFEINTFHADFTGINDNITVITNNTNSEMINIRW